MLVHFVQEVYTCGLTEQKERIHIPTLPQEEKHVHVGKQRYFDPRYWSKVFGLRYLVQGIDPRYLVEGIGPKWFQSKVLRKA